MNLSPAFETGAYTCSAKEPYEKRTTVLVILFCIKLYASFHRLPAAHEQADC